MIQDERFFKEIRWNIQAVPPHLLSERLRDVVTEFCRESWVIYRDVTVDNPVYDGDKTTITGLVDGFDPVGVGEVNGVTPVYTLAGSDITLTLPDLPATIELKVALAPTGEYPDELAPYVKGIASGVMAELFAMPGKAWTEPGLAEHHNGLYESAVSKAKADWFRNYGKKGTARWV